MTQQPRRRLCNVTFHVAPGSQRARSAQGTNTPLLPNYRHVKFLAMRKRPLSASAARKGWQAAKLQARGVLLIQPLRADGRTELISD